MPKPFTEREKNAIRAQMRQKGAKLFEKQGLKKTSVDELSRAAGVSKGAFYLFYDSKEELFLEALEELEKDFRARVFDFSATSKKNARALLADFLNRALLTWDEFPLLKNLTLADFEYLVRKLPAERIQKHLAQDDDFVREFLERIRREGIVVKAPPNVISGLMKSLFFVSLHRDDLGSKDYVETMKALTGLVARYITEGP